MRDERGDQGKKRRRPGTRHDVGRGKLGPSGRCKRSHAAAVVGWGGTSGVAQMGYLWDAGQARPGTSTWLNLFRQNRRTQHSTGRRWSVALKGERSLWSWLLLTMFPGPREVFRRG